MFTKYEVIKNSVINNRSYVVAFNDTARKNKPIKFKTCKFNNIDLDTVPKNSVFVKCKFHNITISGKSFRFIKCTF